MLEILPKANPWLVFRLNGSVIVSILAFSSLALAIAASSAACASANCLLRTFCALSVYLIALPEVIRKFA